MQKKTFLISLTLFLIMGLNSSFAQPRIQQRIQPSSQQNVTQAQGIQRAIRDNPVIREFSLNPSYWLAGNSGSATFRWRVESAPGGSSIARVTITKTEGNGPTVNTSSSNPSGEWIINIPSSIGAGRTTYALTAVNQAGNTSTATVILDVVSLDVLKEKISITLQTIPVEYPGIQGTSCEYIIRVDNRSDITFSGVEVGILARNILGSSPATPVAKITSQIIKPGTNEYRIRYDVPSWILTEYRGYVYIGEDRYDPYNPRHSERVIRGLRYVAEEVRQVTYYILKQAPGY